MTSFETIVDNANKRRGFLIQGLDPDIERIPSCVKNQWGFNSTMVIVSFLIPIIDATAPFVAGWKPNISFFIDFDEEDIMKFYGQEALAIICQYIRNHYPDHVLILDSKDGDIGKSNKGYAKRAFDGYKVDAVTWDPYLGPAIVGQVEKYSGKGFIALGRTSNPEGAALQNLELIDGRRVFEATVDAWMILRNAGHSIGFVAGATHPDELKAIRARTGDAVLLIPGVGDQGGDGPTVMKAGFGGLHGRMLINISGASLYASNTERFADAAADYMDAARAKMSIEFTD